MMKRGHPKKKNQNSMYVELSRSAGVVVRREQIPRGVMGRGHPVVRYGTYTWYTYLSSHLRFEVPGFYARLCVCRLA
jgi:hypothetical protein